MPDALLYNPHDGLSKFTYRGTEFEIEPNKVTKVVVPEHLLAEKVTPQVIAGHAVATVGKWGVCIVSGDAKKDEPRKEEAEQTYAKAMREWAEEVLLAYEEDQAPRRTAGLQDTEPSAEVAQAKRWLTKRGFLK